MATQNNYMIILPCLSRQLWIANILRAMYLVRVSCFRLEAFGCLSKVIKSPRTSWWVAVKASSLYQRTKLIHYNIIWNIYRWQQTNMTKISKHVSTVYVCAVSLFKKCLIPYSTNYAIIWSNVSTSGCDPLYLLIVRSSYKKAYPLYIDIPVIW